MNERNVRIQQCTNGFTVTIDGAGYWETSIATTIADALALVAEMLARPAKPFPPAPGMISAGATPTSTELPA